MVETNAHHLSADAFNRNIANFLDAKFQIIFHGRQVIEFVNKSF